MNLRLFANNIEKVTLFFNIINLFGHNICCVLDCVVLDQLICLPLWHTKRVRFEANVRRPICEVILINIDTQSQVFILKICL